MNDINIDQIVNKINKRVGRPIASSAVGFEKESIPTGSFSLDVALGGGWPAGRSVLLWGNLSSTKSTLCLWTIANAQKLGKKCVYIDTEKTFDTGWAEKNGVDVDELMVARVSTTEDIMELSKDLLQENVFDVLVVDSISALNSEKFFEEGNSSVGIHARSLGEVLTKFNKWNTKTLILLISQTRVKFSGLIAKSHYMGGNAVDHYTSIILSLFASNNKDTFINEEITSGSKITKVPIGRKIRWKVEKSKIGRPFVEGQYTFYFDGGNDINDEILDLAVKYGLVERKGAWIEINGETIQGLPAMKEWLVENPEEAERLKKEILEWNS